MTLLRIKGIYIEPGKLGGLIWSQRATFSEYKRTGIVKTKQTQNLFRNIATEWPACLS